VRIILAVLWVAGMLSSLNGDTYRLNDPVALQALIANTGAIAASSGLLLAMSIIFVIPILMSVLTLTLKYPVNRLVNRLKSSFAYLAALIDGFSRKVVGYALGRTLSAELTTEALIDALSNRNISGCLTHHSDQGVQYCSLEYINILQANNIKISMSQRANPYDNAKMESFFRTLKVEEVYMFEYDNFEEASHGLTPFIKEVYNSKRLHSSLGYMPPEEFEYNFHNKIRTRQLVLT
jgi:hypothetical protein